MNICKTQNVYDRFFVAAPRESQSPYQRSSFRGGYWAGPKTKEDNRLAYVSF